MNPCKKILFIDSDCLMCNQFALKMLKRDETLIIAPLNGVTYREVNLHFGSNSKSSIILFKSGKFYTKSDAIIGVTNSFLIRLLPKLLRDIFYDLIAKRRYMLAFMFKKIQCEIIEASIAKRILP